MKHLKSYENINEPKYKIGDYVILELNSEDFKDEDVEHEIAKFNKNMKHTAVKIIDIFDKENKEYATIYVGDTSLPIDEDLSMNVIIKEDIKRQATNEEILSFEARLSANKYNI